MDLDKMLADGRILIEDAIAVRTFEMFLRDSYSPDGLPPHWVMAKWGPYMRAEADGPVVELRKFNGRRHWRARND